MLHADGRTDRHAVTNGPFRDFCERAHKVYLLAAFNPYPANVENMVSS